MAIGVFWWVLFGFKSLVLRSALSSSLWDIGGRG